MPKKKREHFTDKEYRFHRGLIKHRLVVNGLDEYRIACILDRIGARDLKFVLEMAGHLGMPSEKEIEDYTPIFNKEEAKKTCSCGKGKPMHADFCDACHRHMYNVEKVIK